MNNNSKKLDELLEKFKDVKKHPEIFEQYIKILGICGICKSKISGKFPKDNICPQCKRDINLNKILK
jgi:uncharacterized CHY-type Zn-finger protein